jgi:serine protease AprX
MRFAPAFALLAFAVLALTPLVPADARPAGTTPPEGALLAPLGSDLDAIEQTMRLPAATWYNDRDGDKVFDSLAARFASDPLAPQPVIVTFVHGADPDAALDAVRAAAGPIQVRYHFRAVGGLAADLTLPQALQVAALPEVRQVEWSQPGEPELDTATLHTGVQAVRGIGVDGSRDGLPDITGDDVVIAIMDTGFDGAHVDLQGKFLRFIDWADDGAEKAPYDTDYHGTHVASIAGGLGKGDAKFKGVAPGAAFVGFQITGGDTKANAIASIDWMLANRNATRVDVSTISFGFGVTTDGTDALELAMDKAWAAGIVAFKSNGNSGPEAGTTTIPGGARGILGVGNMFDDGEGGFRLSSSSSRGPTVDGRVKPDLAAPGSMIMAASNGTGNGYQALSGTSMASPFAAGTAALVLAVDPSLKPDDVRRILTQTAHEWGPGGVDPEYGAGRIDSLRAVQLAAVERATREGWAYDELARFDVPAPATTVHASGELTSQERTATFVVEAAGQPLAVTVIHNASATSVPNPALGGTAAAARAIVVQVIAPDQQVVGTVSQGPTSRQQTFSFTAGQAGTYTIEVRGLAGEEALVYDVSAGLAPAALASLIPDRAAYVGVLDEGSEPAKQAPAPSLAVLAVALLAALAVVLRRR